MYVEALIPIMCLYYIKCYFFFEKNWALDNLKIGSNFFQYLYIYIIFKILAS